MNTVLHLGDCLDAVTGMASLADGSIASIISDPPYSSWVHDKSRRGLTVTHVGGKQDEISERRELGFASLTTDVMEAAADQFARLARRWVLVFCDIESSHLWRGALVSTGALEYVRTLAWHKVGGAPQFTGDRPAVWGEAIVACHPKGRKRWNGGGKQGLYSIPTAIDRDRTGLDERIHTTQKPVKLMQELIRDFTDEGETILDAFAGSGTTLFAAARLGRNAIGWELDPANHAAAVERLTSVGREPGTPAGQMGIFTEVAK